ncbi:hypothetical protein BDAG_00380 [Burkholderia dolosa AU0158]|nr:hypothetical protein BDAG_00380 [Burkholderia dolosa AU0158]
MRPFHRASNDASEVLPALHRHPVRRDRAGGRVGAQPRVGRDRRASVRGARGRVSVVHAEAEARSRRRIARRPACEGRLRNDHARRARSRLRDRLAGRGGRRRQRTRPAARRRERRPPGVAVARLPRPRALTGRCR